MCLSASAELGNKHSCGYIVTVGRTHIVIVHMSDVEVPVAHARKKRSLSTNHAIKPTRQRKLTKITPVVKASSVDQPLPNRFCNIIHHPFTQQHCVLLNTNEFHTAEVLIPHTVYDSKPRGLVPKAGHPDSAGMYRQIINVFAYLAKATMESRKETDPDTKKQMSIPSSNRVTITWEDVPSRKNPLHFVARRLRITEHAPPGDCRRGLPTELAELIDKNESRMMDQYNGKKIPKSEALSDPCSHLYVGRDRWQTLCRFYLGRNQDAADATLRPGSLLFHRSHPRNIINVFSIKNSLDMAKQLKSVPKYYSKKRYLEMPDGAPHGFADGSNVYEIMASDISPLENHLTLMPSIGIKVAVCNRQTFDMAEQLHGVGNVDHHHFTRTCETENPNDIHHLKSFISSAKAELRSLYPEVSGMRPGRYFDEIAAQSKEWNTSMSEIIHPDGNAPPSVQSIARWRETNLAENNQTAWMPTTNNFINLTPFQADMANEITMLTTLCTVISCQKQIAQMITAAQYVFIGSNDRPHQLILGPPGVNKSFSLLKMCDLLIPGTTRPLTGMTAKGMTEPGNANDALVIVMEDASATFFGVNKGNKNGTATSTDMENCVKQMMTSCFITTQACVMEPSRHVVVYRADACNIIMAAMNDEQTLFSHAILSRVALTIATDDSREPEGYKGPTRLDMMDRASAQGVKDAEETIKYQTQWMQWHMCEVQYRIRVGILPQVNMKVASTIYGLVNRHYSKTRKNFSMHDNRKYARFRSQCTVFCLRAAINKYWRAPDSPLRGKEHHPDHYLLLAKDLYVKEDEAWMAMGFSRPEFQSDVMNKTIAAIGSTFFPNAAAKFEKRTECIEELVPLLDKPVAPSCYIPSFATNRAHGTYRNSGVPGSGPGSEQFDSGNPPEVRAYKEALLKYETQRSQCDSWATDTCAFGTPALPTLISLRGSGPTPSEIINHLVDIVVNKIQPAPLKKEIESAISNMFNTKVVETREVFVNGVTQVQNVTLPVLQWDTANQCLKMLLSSIDCATDQDPYFNCCREVLQMMFCSGSIAGGGPSARKVSFMFGDTEAKRPSVYRMMTVTKTENSMQRHRVPLQRFDATYFPDAMARHSRAYVTSVRGSDTNNYTDPMADVFHNRPSYQMLDCDIEQNAMREHTDSLGMCAAEQHAVPSNDRTITDKIASDYARERSIETGIILDCYPRCYDEPSEAAAVSTASTSSTVADKHSMQYDAHAFDSRQSLRCARMPVPKKRSRSEMYVSCSVSTTGIKLNSLYSAEEQKNKDEKAKKRQKQKHKAHERMLEESRLAQVKAIAAEAEAEAEAEAPSHVEVSDVEDVEMEFDCESFRQADADQAMQHAAEIC